MICPTCGAPDQATSFCTGCGLRMPGGTPPAASPAAPPAAPRGEALNAPGAMLQSSAPDAPAAATVNTVQAGIGTQAAKARQESPVAYLDLQDSEAAVVHAASRIYAAYVQSGAVTAETETQFIERSTRAAVKLAVLTDRLVQAKDEEW